MASIAYHPNSLLHLISRPLERVQIKEFSRQELEAAFRLGPKPPRPVQKVVQPSAKPVKQKIKQIIKKQEPKKPVPQVRSVESAPSLAKTNRKQKLASRAAVLPKAKKARKPKPSSLIKKHFLPVIQNLMCKEFSPALRNPFNVKITKALAREIAPGYHDIIKKPMDFRTIESKVRNGKYSRPSQFAADVTLVFDNCVLYNTARAELSVWAEELRSEFTQEYNKILPHEDLTALRKL